MDDLREFLDKLAELPGELLTANGPVSAKLELTRAVYKLSRQGRNPAVLYKNVDGKGIPVVTNLFYSRKRMAVGLGCSEAELNQVYRDREKNFIKPKLVSSAPVQEIVLKGDDVDLGKLPIVTHNTDDGGPYITSGVGTTIVPETGIPNAGIYRLQLLGKNKTGIDLGIHSHINYIYQRYCALGKDMPIAVTIGAAPTVYMGALSFEGIDTDAYEIMGALQQKPLEIVKCVTIDSVVPAHGEICLEGYIGKDVKVDEGPLGEFATLYGPKRRNPVFNVTAITMRKAPIYMDICSGWPDHQQIGSLPRVGKIQAQVKLAAPGVKDVYLPLSAFGRNACYVSIEKTVDGEPANVAAAVFSADPFVRHVVVVDPDVNVFDEGDVIRAISLYMRPENCFIIHNAKGSNGDPTARGHIVTKIGIDATKPYGVKSEKINYNDGLDEIDLKKIFGEAVV